MNKETVNQDGFVTLVKTEMRGSRALKFIDFLTIGAGEEYVLYGLSVKFVEWSGVDSEITRNDVSVILSTDGECGETIYLKVEFFHTSYNGFDFSTVDVVTVKPVLSSSIVFEEV